MPRFYLAISMRDFGNIGRSDDRKDQWSKRDVRDTLVRPREILLAAVARLRIFPTVANVQTCLREQRKRAGHDHVEEVTKYKRRGSACVRLLALALARVQRWRLSPMVKVLSDMEFLRRQINLRPSGKVSWKQEGKWRRERRRKTCENRITADNIPRWRRTRFLSLLLFFL